MSSRAFLCNCNSPSCIMTNPAVPPSTSAFSSNTDFSTEPVEPLNEPVHSATAGDLLEQYEILETVDRISKGGYKRVRVRLAMCYQVLSLELSHRLDCNSLMRCWATLFPFIEN